MNPSKKLVFIKPGTHNYIHVDLSLEVSTGKIEVIISESKDGINTHFRASNQPVVESFPPLSGDLKSATQAAKTHLRDYGFRLLDEL